jgi:Ca-activated chloride channel homolog
MIFLKANFAIWLVPLLISAVFAVLYNERTFFRWVKEYWLFRRSKTNKLSSILFVIGFSLLAVIILDPREGEIKIKGKIKQSKTIVLVDTSTSMLVEDVRPNRLEKAALMAKHFVRNAVGHHISVLIFADITKKLVPFTTDIDLLDSRIESIKELKNMNAGTSIGLAIEEAVRFFKSSDDNYIGNIVVFTDGEDNFSTEKFNFPNNINLVLVGVGTEAGGSIPMKDNRGMFYGHKRSKGKTVISKLNRDFFESSLGARENSKYIIVGNYDLPTNEILDFFESRKQKEQDGENIIRPVAMGVIAIPALCLIFLALVLRNFRSFLIALFIMLVPLQGFSDDTEEKKRINRMLGQLQQNKLSKSDKISLADLMVKNKMHDLGHELYRENLNSNDKGKNYLSYFNWATSELEQGKYKEALEKFNNLEELIENNKIPHDLKQKIRENIKKAMENSSSNKNNKDNKDKNKESSPKDSKENKEQEDGQSSDGGQSQQNKKQESDGQDQEKENPFSTQNEDKKHEVEESEKEDRKEPSEQGNEQERQEKKESQGNDENSSEEKKSKNSPLLEQLKQDDRKLQLKLLDTSTQKNYDGRKKDW